MVAVGFSVTGLGEWYVVIGFFVFLYILSNFKRIISGEIKTLEKVMMLLLFLIFVAPLIPKINFSSSSSSSKTLENGQIPGYRSCIEEMMTNNPNAKQRTCCDRLGGSWSQKGSFGTCRK
jgi:hypothetical protein